jgi:glutamate synthase domain-containing protein 3
MAGGILILLGLNVANGTPIVGDYLGTGMHGGVIYIRNEVDPEKCGKEVGVMDTDEDDLKVLTNCLKEYSEDLGMDLEEIMKKPFKKLIPVSSRPYGNLYAY